MDILTLCTYNDAFSMISDIELGILLWIRSVAYFETITQRSLRATEEDNAESQ